MNTAIGSPNPEYGNVWYPRVEPGWAPYHTGHWAWIDPWGWTWVDDAPWGYAPFHYGRWASVGGRWGWIPGPREVRPVYAPALVVFVGGGGPGIGGNVAWFPLGPREVYVPPYHVSPTYVNRVNISNTTVNQTTVTNVYNTTIVNNNTTVNNVTYVNRNVNGAVTAVPQHAFAGGQPVARSAVTLTRQQIAAAPVNVRVAVAPTQTAVMGPRGGTANPVAAPPRAVFTRPVIAKAAPPPAPVSFAAKQQVLAAHPGQPVARQEMQHLRPATPTATQPVVKQAPPGKPATPNVVPVAAHPGNQPSIGRTNRRTRLRINPQIGRGIRMRTNVPGRLRRIGRSQTNPRRISRLRINLRIGRRNPIGPLSRQRAMIARPPHNQTVRKQIPRHQIDPNRIDRRSRIVQLNRRHAMIVQRHNRRQIVRCSPARLRKTRVPRSSRDKTNSHPGRRLRPRVIVRRRTSHQRRRGRNSKLNLRRNHRRHRTKSGRTTRRRISRISPKKGRRGQPRYGHPAGQDACFLFAPLGFRGQRLDPASTLLCYHEIGSEMPFRRCL